MDCLIKSKLLTVVHKSRVHDKFADFKLLLSDSNCNDNGYYTSFRLWLQLPEKEVNLKVAELNILNVGQKAGENPTISTTSSMFTFIRDFERAYMILFIYEIIKCKVIMFRLSVFLFCLPIFLIPACA